MAKGAILANNCAFPIWASIYILSRFVEGWNFAFVVAIFSEHLTVFITSKAQVLQPTLPSLEHLTQVPEGRLLFE